MNTISYCEILHVFCDNEEKNTDIIKKSMLDAGYTSLQRIYVGSNFCCRYFLKYIASTVERLAKIKSVSEGDFIKLTLCVPVFSELYLEQGKTTIQTLINEYSDIIDEVTVNDYGMLDFVCNIGMVKVNVGRMLNKDARDVRYDEYFNTSKTPSICTLNDTILNRYDINCIELDLTNRFLNLSSCKYDVAVYAPYCFATVGNICEYAGVSMPVEKKFRANYICGYNCAQMSMDYETPYGEKYLKIGRTVFFKVEDYSISSEKPVRLIYEPFDLFKPGRNNDE